LRAAAEPGALRARRRQVDSLEDVGQLLAEFARTRDLELRNRLVILHEPLVRHLVNQFSPGVGHSSEDLLQVGFLGLIGAIERFNPETGVRFMTFAVPTIVGVLKRYLRDHGWLVRAPRQLRELGTRLSQLRADLEQRLGRSPTVLEMAEAAGVTEERLLHAMDLNGILWPASLDAPPPETSGDGTASFWETVGQIDPRIAAVEEREALRRALESLEPRQRAILHFRFFGHASQAEIAKRLGISQMHVSRLQRRALKLLKAELTGQS
jgi:RNA polymerase sigma-B factor